MPVILSNRPHTSQTRKLTCLFISIYRRRFKITNRHITIAKLIISENLHMMRTVHRLHKEVFLLSLYSKKLISKLIRMPWGFVEVFFGKVRSSHPFIAFIFVKLPKVVLNFFSNNHSMWLQKRQSWSNQRWNRKNFQLLTQDSMVSFFGFFKKGLIVLKLFFGIKC